MRPSSITDPAGSATPTSPRPDFAEGPPAPTVTGRIGYRFDAVPEALHDEVKAGWLKPIDLAVVVEMIRWGSKRGRRDSCWTTRKVIADAIDRDPRTVQSSWSRLEARGWIDRETFGGDGRPDPDDPANYTGSRIVFNWASGRTRPARDPAEVPPARRNRGRPRKGSQGRGEKFISPPREAISETPEPPPPETWISPPGEKLVSPKEEASISNPDRKTSDDVLALAAQEDPQEPPMGTVGFAVEPSSPAPSEPSGSPPPRRTLASRRPGFSTWELAEMVCRRLRDRGINLIRLVDAGGVERIMPKYLTSKTDPIEPGEIADLLEVKPELLAILRGDRKPDGKPAPAPRVPAANLAEVLDRINRLRWAEVTDAQVEETAGLIVAITGPHEDPKTTVDFLEGACRGAKRGTFAVGTLHDGVEASCGPKVRSRGKYLTSWIKRNRFSKR